MAEVQESALARINKAIDDTNESIEKMDTLLPELNRSLSSIGEAARRLIEIAKEMKDAINNDV